MSRERWDKEYVSKVLAAPVIRPVQKDLQEAPGEAVSASMPLSPFCM